MSFKNIVFTSFEKEKLKIDEKFCNFYAYQREKCPKTNSLHWQGMAILKRGQRLKKIKEVIGDEKAHIESMKGTPEQAYKYCTKEESYAGERYEAGELPKSKQGNRSDIDSFRDYVKETKESKIQGIDIMNQFAGIMARYPNFVKTCCETYGKRYIPFNRRACNAPRTLHIIYGLTASGKTTYVKTLDDCHWKNEDTEWWDGYNGHERVVINEFTNTGKINATSLLRLSDIGEITLNIKGGSVALVCKEIWVTTNLEPDTILASLKDVHKAAFLRRCKWYNMCDYKLTEIAIVRDYL